MTGQAVLPRTLSARTGWMLAALVVLLPASARPSDPVVAVNTDGRLEVFVRGNDAQLWHAWQQCAGCGFSGWASLGGGIGSDLAVGTNADGRLEVFAVAGGDLWHIWQLGSGGWSGWQSLGRPPSTSSGNVWVAGPTVAQNKDGRMEVFAQGFDGAIWHIWQTKPNGSWSAWSSLGGYLYSYPAVGRNSDGRLEVFAVGGDYGMWHVWQTSAGGAWSGWSSLGGQFWGSTRTLSVGRNADGRLEVFAGGSGNNQLWHAWQASGGWSGWASLGGLITSAPAVGSNEAWAPEGQVADGRLEVLALGTYGALYHIWQDSGVPSGWSGWAGIGGDFFGTRQPSVGRNKDGRLEAFLCGHDGKVWHYWQPSWGGASLGAPGGGCSAFAGGGSGGVTYSISGNAGIAGATVIAGGRSSVTDSFGNYFISGLGAGTYTVQPSKSGYVFSPGSQTFSVPPSRSGVNFTASASSAPYPFNLLQGVNLATVPPCPASPVCKSGAVPVSAGVPQPPAAPSQKTGYFFTGATTTNAEVRGISGHIQVTNPSVDRVGATRDFVTTWFMLTAAAPFDQQNFIQVGWVKFGCGYPNCNTRWLYVYDTAHFDWELFPQYPLQDGAQYPLAIERNPFEANSAYYVSIFWNGKWEVLPHRGGATKVNLWSGNSMAHEILEVFTDGVNTLPCVTTHFNRGSSILKGGVWQLWTPSTATTPQSRGPSGSNTLYSTQWLNPYVDWNVGGCPSIE